jgi:peptide/nickel transport system substrate-binding protein
MKKALKIGFALLLCCAMLLSVAACGSKPATDTPAASQSGSDSSSSAAPADSNAPANSDAPAASGKDTVNIALTQDRGTLDMTYMMGYDIQDAMCMVYEPMIALDGDDQPIFMLATALNYITPTHWQIKLREGVTFANGNPFNADDAIFTITRWNTRIGEPASFGELIVDSLTKVDDYTVEFDLEKFNVGGIANFSNMYVFDAESFNEDTITTVSNGTGPYVVSDYVINSHIDFTIRDGEYWGEKPHIKNLHFVVLAEEAQRVNALQTGAVDMAAVPFQDIDYVTGLPGLTVDYLKTFRTTALYFNISQHSPMFYENVDARRAVVHAIDPQAIVDIAYSGHAKVSQGYNASDIPDLQPRWNNISLYAIGYNPELAKQLADSSGLTGQTLLLINNGSAADVVTAELIQSNLKDIGVNVDILTLEPGSWLSYAFDDTKFDIMVDFTSASTVAANLGVWVMVHEGESMQRNPWPGSDIAVPMLDKLPETADPAEREAMIDELVPMIEDAALIHALADTTAARAYDSNLKGYNPLTGGKITYSQLAG